MDIAEAKAKLDAVLDELAAAGFSVWGWDDETIQIGQLHGPGAEVRAPSRGGRSAVRVAAKCGWGFPFDEAP